MNLKDKNNNKNESKTQKKFNKGAAIAVATVLSTTLITPLSAHAEGLNNSVNNTSNNIENNNIDHVKVVNEISKGDIAKFGITHSKNLKDIKIVNTAGAVNGKDYTYTSIDNNLLTVNIKKNTSNYNQIISNFKLEGVNKNNNQRIEIPLALSKLPEINLSTTNEESPVSLTLKCTSTNSKENISTTTGANTTDVMYKISYQFKSNTGKDYKITNVKIVPHYKIAYNNPNDMKYKNYLNEALKSLNDNFYSFNTTMGISDFDSTSTGVMILESNYIKSDFNTHLEGTATVYYTIDGKQYKEDVPLQNAKLFGAYDNISQQPQLYYGGQDKKNNAKYVRISIQNPLTNLKYYYIPSQYMMGNPILNITASGGAILSINPQYANDIKYLGNNNYQLTNKLYNSLIETSGLNLFEVSNPHPDQTLQTDISVNSCNYNFPNIKFDSSATLANAYLNLTFTPERGEYAINKHLTVTGYSNNNDQCMLMSGKTTNKNLNDLNKNYNLYSVIMGYSPLLLKMNSTNFINPNYRYVSYPADDMINTQYYNIESYQSGIYTKDEINNRIYDIVTGKSVSGVTVYSGQQLIDMANSGKQLPNIYMVIAKGTSISDVATTGVANMALGMTPANYADYILVGQAKTDMHNSTLYQGWDKLTDINRDSIVKDNNKLEGFVLGGIVASYTGENQGNTETFGPSNIITQTNQSSAIMFSDVRGPGIDTSTAQLSQLGIDPVYTFSGPNGYTTFNMTPEEFYKPTTYYLYSDYKLNPENNVEGAYYTFNIGNNTFTKDSYMEFIYKDNSNNIKHFNVPLSDFSRDSSGDYYYPLSKLPDFKSFNIENDYQAPQSSLLHIQFTTKEPNINQKYYCGILTESGLKNGLVNTLTSINTNNSYINNYMININNKMYNEYQYYGSDPQVTNTNVSINSLANNSCVQKVTNVNRENNTFTINNSIKNNSGLATNYYAIGRIPSNRIKSLASTYGYNGIGKDTYSTMESINIPNGAEVYLIPKSLESKYNDILNTQSISSLSSLSKLITENNSGLVKYKSGMNLNDYIGYIAKSQLITPGQEFDFNIGIKCNGVLKNEKNTMYSGFKYYDSEHSYGSISPIQELNLQDIFQKKVTDSLIQSTENGEELSGVKYEVQFENGKTATVTSDKNGSVNIPTGIIKKVNVVSVPSGWKVDSNKLDTVNNENEISTTDKVVLSKLNTIVNVSATCDNQDVSGVTFNLGKDGDMTTSNKEVSKTFDYNSVNTASVKTIPVGYKADGNIVITRTTDKDGNQVINIVQKLTKIPKNSITVSMVNSKGDVIVKPQTVTDYDGSKVLVPSISVPNGYKLVNITDNGQVIDKLPSSITNKNQNIVYHVIKENTSLTIKYMYNGQEIGEPVNKEIATGSIINNNYINAPSGYKIDNITFDGKTVKDNILNEKASVDPNIVIVNLSKLKETVNISAVCDGKEVPNVVINVDGKNLTTSTGAISEDIPYGSFKDAKVSNIPNGYELNGNISINKTVDKDGNITVNIIQNLKKLATEKVTTEVKDINGNVLVPVTSYSGYEGQNINYKIPTIPKGYEVVKVTDNGNTFTPKTGLLHPNTGVLNDVKDTQHLVWIVQNKETSVTVTYKYNNEIIGKPVVTNIKTGSNLDKTKLNIPTGYNIQSITVNGNKMKDNKIVGTASPNPNTIIVNLGKLHETVNVTATCNGVDVGGVIVKANIGDITTGSSVVSKQVDYNSYKSAIVSSIPEGYQQDGKVVVSTSIDKDGNQIVNINVPLKKLSKGTVTTIVKDTTGNIIDAEKSYTGYENTKDTAVVPTIPQGYKVISITNNNIKCDGLPKEFNNSTQNIVWTVEKENTNVTVEVINKATGKEICTPEIENIKTGSNLGDVKLPNIGDQWKIDSVAVNGQTMKDNKVVGTALPTPNKIVIVVSQKPSVTTEITSNKGNVIVPSKTTIVNEGSSVTPLIPSIPSGYHVDKVKIGDKIYNSIKDIPQTVTKTENINIIVSQNTYTTKVTVKDENGTIIIPTKVITGVSGTSTGLDSSNLIPAGYKVVSVTDNNKPSTINNNAISKITNSNNDIVITVNKEQFNVTTKVIDESNHVIVPSKTTKVDYGSGVDKLIPAVPNGYKLVKYVCNNKDYSIINEIPKTVTSNDNITVIVQKIEKGTINVEVKELNNSTPISTKTYTGDVNSKDTATVPNIPKGYRIVSITNNGQKVNGLPQEFTKETQNVVYQIEKIPTPVQNTKLTIKVENMQGQEIEAPINKEIKVGSKLDNNYMPSIPAKYKIVNVETDNINTGLNINGIAKNGENTIIIKVENKVIKEPVSVTVKDGNSILIPTITKEVNKGTVLNGSFIPNIPTGYKVDSIYVNNSNEGTSLNGEVNGPTNIIVNVSKIVKGSINVTVKDINNNIIVPTKSATGEKGSKDTLNAPIIPSGYKIVSITDNGKVVDGMPKEFTGETQSIIYTVKKINTKVTTEVITQSGQVVTPKNSFDVPTGTSINSLVPNAPSQYKVVGVKVNGKEFTSKADVTGITNGTTENIIVIVNKVVKPVEKEGKVIVEVQGANGNIIVPAVSTTGGSGTADKSSIPSIPVGYKLDYITNNGQKVNGLPEKYNDGTQTIIYHVSKIVNKSTISIVTKSTDGKILVGESSVSGAPGTPTALGLDIPSGYHLVKIIDNGKEIKSLPQKFNNENQNIEIIAEKNKDNIIKPVNNTPNNIPTNTPSNIQNNTPIKTSNNIPTTNTPNISNNNLNNSPITISHNNKTNNPDTNINGKQNPKTGDTSEIPFALGILAALGALIGINVKKKKPSTEKIDN